MCKLIICGSRTIQPYPWDMRDLPRLRAQHPDWLFLPVDLMNQAISSALEVYFPNQRITEVVSGKAAGGDHFGELWAAKYKIPVKPFAITPEEWRLFGRHGKMGAGQRRNRQMGDYIDRTKEIEGAGVLAIWDGKSHGTQGMLDYAKELGIKRVVIEIKHGKVSSRELR